MALTERKKKVLRSIVDLYILLQLFSFVKDYFRKSFVFFCFDGAVMYFSSGHLGMKTHNAYHIINIINCTHTKKAHPSANDPVGRHPYVLDAEPAPGSYEMFKDNSKTSHCLF